MTDEQTFLADILANPDDDTVRLVYADWLEERAEQRERAEFIRVQCEYEKFCTIDIGDVQPLGGPVARDGVQQITMRSELLTNEVMRRVVCYRPGPGTPFHYGMIVSFSGEYTKRPRPGQISVEVQIINNWTGYPRENELRQRAWKLFLANSASQHLWMGAVHDVCRAGSEWTSHLPWFRRGFVEFVTSPAEDWFRYADRIRTEQPVRHVTLTDRPIIRMGQINQSEQVREKQNGVKLRSRWNAAAYGVTIPMEVETALTEQDLVLSREPIDYIRHKHRAHVVDACSLFGYLKARWPGIKFTAPGESYATWMDEAPLADFVVISGSLSTSPTTRREELDRALELTESELTEYLRYVGPMDLSTDRERTLRNRLGELRKARDLMRQAERPI